MERIRVCVVGATGFAGIEVCRLVLGHPNMELAMVTDRKEAGTRLDAVYPSFAGACDLELSLPEPDAIAQAADVAFLAVPHTASLALTPELLRRGVTVLDLSADYRLHDPQVYEQWYNTPHTSPELLSQTVYGLPELNREGILALAERRAAGQAVLVSVPGCYPTATALAATPALSAGLAGGDLVIADAISGVSGAGRGANARTHYCHANESVEAYGVAKHRHTPEIEQTMQALRQFMFERVYKNPVAKGEESKARRILQELYTYYIAHPEALPQDFQPQLTFEGLPRVVCDYIAGMTDKYAMYKYDELFIPTGWQVRG